MGIDYLFFLVTYHRTMDRVDSAVQINSRFDGKVEIGVIDDTIENSEQPCLLVAVKDNHKILIVEGISICDQITLLVFGSIDW